MTRPALRLAGRRAHCALNILLAAALMALVQLIALRLDRTFSFPVRPQALSQRATSLLSQLSGTIRCIVVLPHNNAFYDNVRQLLRNMEAAAVHATLDLQFPDPHINVSQAADAVRRHGADGWCLIFEKDDAFEIVPYESLIERTHVETDSLLPGSVVHTRFRGEQPCITALARLARPVQPLVYTLTGHGEHDFSDYDRLTGYSDLAREIRREGYRLKSLSLADAAEVPADCNLLVVAGPRRPPLPAEADALVSYLARGGRLLFLADRAERLPSGWEPVAARLGLRFANLTAITEGSMGGYSLAVDYFSDHPVARDLRGSAVTFSSPQVLDVDADFVRHHRLRTHVVARAPTKAWGETTPEILPRRYDPGIDRKGDLPLAVAVEVDGGDDLGLDFMKAFVVGDSNVGLNAFLGGGGTANRDFLLNAVDWLTDSGLPYAPSRAAEGNALQLNISRRRQMRFWGISVVGWPLAACLFGAFAALVRRLFS